jgi:NTP pyrophosphatase (non-canonical NTP hydrolase)
MKEQEYKNYVDSLRNDNLDCSNVVLIHGVFGIASEAGELIDIVKKHMVYHQPVNIVHLKEELGDLLYYFTCLTSKYNWTLEELMEENFQKLTKRYPNGYSDNDALARKDKK